MENRTASLQPRVCKLAVLACTNCMVVLARPYYTVYMRGCKKSWSDCMYKLYGRASATILHARASRVACTQRAGTMVRTKTVYSASPDGHEGVPPSYSLSEFREMQLSQANQASAASANAAAAATIAPVHRPSFDFQAPASAGRRG
eukprot:COSAG02_NODE_28637_length_585_cov_2.390947_1_plen_146_part_10